MKPTARRVLLILAGGAVLALLALTIVLLSRPVPEVLQGEIDATEVNVSAKIPARVAELRVHEGDTVRKGDLLALLDSPEITAKLEQAEAARAGASAQKDKADAGAREEEVRAAKNLWERARSGAELAEKTFARVDRLHRDGVLPLQRRDEAEAQAKAARSAEEAARASYDMAQTGTRSEDRRTAASLVDRAKGAVSEVQAFASEMRLTAPAAGEVFRRNVEPGEVVGAGYPIVTLVDLADVWAVFHLREDRLAGWKPGDTFTARVPALSGREVRFRVSYVAPQGDFATFRATNAQGGFDLKTFEVRARPVDAATGLRPGMSVLLAGPHAGPAR